MKNFVLSMSDEDAEEFYKLMRDSGAETEGEVARAALVHYHWEWYRISDGWEIGAFKDGKLIIPIYDALGLSKKIFRQISENQKDVQYTDKKTEKRVWRFFLAGCLTIPILHLIYYLIHNLF